MKYLLVSIAVFALATPAFAQASQCPTGFVCTPDTGNYTTPGPAASLPQAVVSQSAQVAEPVVAAASKVTYLPKWYGSVGAGGLTVGKGRFAYESISAYLGAETYATTVNEYTMQGGKVTSCTLAGLSKLLYQFGIVSVGTTGLGGGCNSTDGNNGAAGAVQGFASFHVKGAVSIVLTGDKTFTTDGRQAVKVTLGISYGK